MSNRMNFPRFLAVLLPAALFTASGGLVAGETSRLADLEAKDLVVLAGRKGYENFEEQLARYLGEIGSAAYRERKERLEAVSSREEYETYLEERRRSFLAGIGPFPKKTPLNAKSFGRIDCGGYLIEKVAFESRPGYVVTANLYIPRRHKPPWPVVLCPMGHWGGNQGKDFHYVQKRGAGLAGHGYLTLVFEPFGQGERRIYFDPALEKKTPLGWGTNQHAYLNYQLQLTGHNMANFFIWDGIRALDYLLGREGADSTRVAVTGASGGGSQTRIISAADPRVKAAIPVCANSHIGGDYHPGRGNPDGEQNVPGMSRYGIEYADQLIMSRANGILLMNASGDRGSIVSSVDMYNDIQGLFSRAGVDRRVDYRLIGSDHSYNRDFRETLYHWLNRLFGKEDEPGVEQPLEVLPTEKLNVTAAGTVEELSSETPLTLNRKYVEEIAPARMKLGSRADISALKKNLKDRMRALLQLEQMPKVVEAHSFGIERARDFTLEKVAISPEAGIRLPGVLLSPAAAETDSSVLLYIHERGKANGPAVIRRLVRSGRRVFALDVRGFRESPDPHPELGWTSNGERKYELIYGATEYDADYNAYCYQLQRSLFGMRAGDVLAAAAYLRSREDVDPDAVSICGYGDGALLALHAAVLDDKIETVALNRLLISFRSLATEPFWSHSPFLFITDVIAHYDVPELLAALAPGRVLVANAVDELRRPLDISRVRKSYEYSLQGYRAAGSQKNLWIGITADDLEFAEKAAALGR